MVEIFHISGKKKRRNELKGDGNEENERIILKNDLKALRIAREAYFNKYFRKNAKKKWNDLTDEEKLKNYEELRDYLLEFPRHLNAGEKTAVTINNKLSRARLGAHNALEGCIYMISFGKGRANKEGYRGYVQEVKIKKFFDEQKKKTARKGLHLHCTVHPQNAGSITPHGDSYHTKGTIVAISCRPNKGWLFYKWIIDGREVTTPSMEVEIEMDTNHTVMAVFRKLIEPRRAKTGSLHGRVYHFQDGKRKGGIPHAIVSLIGINISARTNRSGYYRINNIPIGEHIAVAEKGGAVPELGAQNGYVSQEKDVEIHEGRLRKLDFDLEPVGEREGGGNGNNGNGDDNEGGDEEERRNRHFPIHRIRRFEFCGILPLFIIGTIVSALIGSAWFFMAFFFWILWCIIPVVDPIEKAMRHINDIEKFLRRHTEIRISGRNRDEIKIELAIARLLMMKSGQMGASTSGRALLRKFFIKRAIKQFFNLCGFVCLSLAFITLPFLKPLGIIVMIISYFLVR